MKHSTKKLKYFAFDFDNNILNMCSKIHMDKIIDGKWIPVATSTARYAKIRNNPLYRPRNNNYDIAFAEFTDNGKRGNKAFLQDIQKSLILKKFGPCWNIFKKSLINGNIFSIITARGHNSDTIKNAIKWIVFEYFTIAERNKMVKNLKYFHTLFNIKTELLIENYLDSCEYYGVTSDDFMRIFNVPRITAKYIEEGKKLALDRFAQRIDKFGKRVNMQPVLGFSDDDKKNIIHIETLMKEELSLKYMIEYRLYDTSNPKIKGGRKIII
jgi:hypothetical protein